MSDPLGPVQRGDDAATTIFDSARINAWSAAARKVRDQWPRADRPAAMPTIPKLEVTVRNDTGADLDAFACLAVQTDTIVNPVTVPYEFARRPVFAGDTPAATTDQPLILSEPIPNGQFGRAVIEGVVVADVQLVDTDYEYARPIAGDNTRLRGSPSGPARILWKAATLGSRVRCVLLLGIDTPVDAWFTTGTGQQFWPSPLTSSWEIGNGVTYDKDITILTEPGYYKVWLSYCGAILPKRNIAGHSTAALFARFRTPGLGINYSGAAWVCMGTNSSAWNADYTSFHQVLSPGSGGGVLMRDLHLTADNVPYAIGITWLLLMLGPATQGGDGSQTFEGIHDLFEHVKYETGCEAIRVPGIYRQTSLGGWSVLPPSAPVPPLTQSALAVADAYTVPEGGQIDVPTPGVLGNDTVPAGYYAVQDSWPQFGTLAFQANGSFVYKQDVPLTGRPPIDDTFAYHLTNGTTNSSVVTVTITITGGGREHISWAIATGGGTGTVGSSGSVSPPPPPMPGDDPGIG